MTDDALLARVLAEAPSLPFVSLVHWLERLHDAEIDAAGRGPVVLRHAASLAFHPSDHEAARRTDRPGVVVTAAFAGVTGAVSPLPTPALEALARDDERLLPESALLDGFHHRLLALLYRALRACDPAREGDGARLHDWLLALAGFPSGALASATSLPRARLLRLAPLLITQAPQSTRLRMALVDQLGTLLDGAEVQVVPLRGDPVTVAPSERPRLGVSLRLGSDGVLGARCPAPAGAIEVVLGPLTAEAYLALRPGGDASRLLTDVLRLLVPERLAVQVTLRPSTLPRARLRGARLGSAWLARGALLPCACFAA